MRFAPGILPRGAGRLAGPPASIYIVATRLQEALRKETAGDPIIENSDNSAGLDLPAGLANFLKDRHQVRLTDRSAVSSGLEFVRCDLGHGRGTNDLVRGMDAIIHWGQVDSRSATTAAQLDYHTRCTYNLLYAASAEKVPLLVYLSSLAIMHKYDEDLKVTEHWRPLPTTEPEVLCCHLGELVCREFVREGRIAVACLRLGEVVRRGQAPASSSALYLDDALEAVEAAISWGHRAPSTERRTSPAAGRNELGIVPHPVAVAQCPLFHPRGAGTAAIQPCRQRLTNAMKVLLLGANGMLGPHALRALEGHFELRLADIAGPKGIFGHRTGFRPDETQGRHQYHEVDVSNPAQVMAAAEGMDAIVNLSVLRNHRIRSFAVNVLGSYNIMAAAVEHGIRRVISSGAHFTGSGP